MKLLLLLLIIIILCVINNNILVYGWGTESKQPPKAKIYLSKNFPEFESNFDTPMPIINRYSYVDKIKEMGWTEKEARVALEKNRWLLDEAVDYLSRFSNGLRNVAPCIGKNNCFVNRKTMKNTVSGSSSFSFKEKYNNNNNNNRNNNNNNNNNNQAQRITNFIKPSGYPGTILPGVHLIDYNPPKSSIPIEAPLSFIELNDHIELDSNINLDNNIKRAKAHGLMSGGMKGCKSFPQHIHKTALLLVDELYHDPSLLEVVSKSKLNEAEETFEKLHRNDLKRLWRTVIQHMNNERAPAAEDAETLPAIDSYQYKRPAARTSGFNHINTHPPPPAGPMRLVPVAYPKPYMEDHQNICHKVLPASLPTQANIKAGKAKPVAKSVNPACKQPAWTKTHKTSDYFVREMQRRIKCAQKDWIQGPPGWLQARLRWQAAMKKQTGTADIRGRGGYQLPQEAWPVNVPVATQGKCCAKRDMWRKPLVPKTTPLRKMTKANAKMKLEAAFSAGPPNAKQEAGGKEQASGKPEAEGERPIPQSMNAHADTGSNIPPIDDLPVVDHEQAKKDYPYDDEPDEEPTFF